MAKLFAVVILILTFAKSSFCQSQPIADLKQLYNDTLTGYDTRIRPRLYQSETVLVNSSFVPNNIIEFDTTEQKFSILGQFKLSWIDEVLTWDPTSYSGIDTIKIPVKEIWKPSLILSKVHTKHENDEFKLSWIDEVLTWDPTTYSGIDTIKIPVKEIWKPSLILSKAFDGSGIIGDSSTDIVKVTNDGLVSWSPEGIFSYVCEVDIQFYPFDEQVCVLTYYVSDETRVTVSLSHYDEVSTSEYIKNSEWDLIKISRTSNLRYNAYFIDITFKVQRRASFTTFTIIIPLLMLSFLNICVFLVPIGSGEKGSFCITIFLSYGIFVTIVSDTLPHNSLQVSYFVLFLIVLLMLSVLSVFYTILQAKMVAAFGDKECKLTLACLTRKRSKTTKVHPVDSQNSSVFSISDVTDDETKQPTVVVVDGVPVSDKGDNSDGSAKQEEDAKTDADGEAKSPNVFTWAMFFQTLDTVLFVIFFVLILVSSSIFFSLMMQRIGSSTLSKVNPS